MATIIFEIPDDYAARMRQESGEFYLDVFGGVRDRVSTEFLGRWAQTEELTFR